MNFIIIIDLSDYGEKLWPFFIVFCNLTCSDGHILIKTESTLTLKEQTSHKTEIKSVHWTNDLKQASPDSLILSSHSCFHSQQ